MRIAFDIEADGLENPTRIWVVVCKDIDSGLLYIFREGDREKFNEFSTKVSYWIGHNILEYDWPVLCRLWGSRHPSIDIICDTLIVSRLFNYSRSDGHSIAAYGEEFGLEKIDFLDFTQWSQEMEDYCVRDVDICERVYLKYRSYRSWSDFGSALQLEQEFQRILVDLHRFGFAFNHTSAGKLLTKVEEELGEIDSEFKSAFPARLTPIREITPRLTRHNTLHKSDFRWAVDGDLTPYSAGATFTLCRWVPFNPSSHKQIVEVLYQAGWAPTVKTKTHIEFERQRRDQTPEEQKKKDHLVKYGWKINEENLGTLPETAPRPARLLAKRILLESRRRTITEWLSLAKPDGRIHGKFYGIGAWTHRMAHQEPNTANIPNEFHQNNSVKLYGKEMRALWQAPRNRLLVGVDAEGIQLRIFAHYIDDKEFTKSLIEGDSNAGTDPHSLNKRILGDKCQSRDAAKRFIYALLLGAGIRKLGEILECSQDEAQVALDRIMERYQGFNDLKKNVIPHDAKRGWFVGLDGRRVIIPGETSSERRHLCMSGYLQNGEVIVIKKAAVHFEPLLKEYNANLVDIIHDEFQVEVPNNMEVALGVAKLVASSIELAGEDLELRCPMSGSYWSKRHKDFSIGKNWWQTH